MNVQTILVAVAAHEWTLEALHQACRLARRTGAQIALVRMVQVQHVGWLGTELGDPGMSHQERLNINEYRATLEDYGIPYRLTNFQYATFNEALEQAVDQADAQIVFAAVPRSIIPHWHRFQSWRLGQRMEMNRRVLFTLEHGDHEVFLNEQLSSAYTEAPSHAEAE
jgi:nucleotide-binding universal stress UspA family protein